MKGTGTLPAKWIFTLACVVILIAIAPAILLLFWTPAPTRFQYRLSIALVCFALSSVAGLLFAAKVEMKGTVGVISVTLGGTAALWLATLLVFNYIFPEQSLEPRREYDISLNLIFPESDPPNPFTAKVNPYVQREGEPAEGLYPHKKVLKGVGGVVVQLDKLGAGDRLFIVAEDEGRTWRSNDMVTPNAQLQMNKMGTGHP